MIEELRALDVRVKALRKTVRALTTRQVGRKSDREAAKGIVDSYFRSVRENIQIGGATGEDVESVDHQMHILLDASHKHSAKTTYDSCLKRITDGLLVIEKRVLMGLGSSPVIETEPTDQRIIETLSRVLPSAARAYEQALRDLSGPSRLSWRGPATDLRESLRETLDHLAPDTDVIAQPGFKLEAGANGPTMKQKVRFILLKRGQSKGQSKASEAAATAVDEMVGQFVRSVYTRSSVSTHTPTEREEVLRIHAYVRASLSELLAVHT